MRDGGAGIPARDGGGCQSPVAAYAEIDGNRMEMRAVSFREGPAKARRRKTPDCRSGGGWANNLRRS